METSTALTALTPPSLGPLLPPPVTTTSRLVSSAPDPPPLHFQTLLTLSPPSLDPSHRCRRRRPPHRRPCVPPPLRLGQGLPFLRCLGSLRPRRRPAQRPQLRRHRGQRQQRERRRLPEDVRERRVLGIEHQLHPGHQGLHLRRCQGYCLTNHRHGNQGRQRRHRIRRWKDQR